MWLLQGRSVWLGDCISYLTVCKVKFYLCVCVCVSGYVHVSAAAQGIQRRLLDPLELGYR